MAKLIAMKKEDLIKEVRKLRQDVKLLAKQLEVKTDESGEFKGDLKVPVFYLDNKTNRFITGIADISITQLDEIQEHGTSRHLAEQRILMYCEDTLYDQELEE